MSLASSGAAARAVPMINLDKETSDALAIRYSVARGTAKFVRMKVQPTP